MAMAKAQNRTMVTADEELRLQALRLATQVHDTADETVKRAEVYSKFLIKDE